MDLYLYMNYLYMDLYLNDYSLLWTQKYVYNTNKYCNHITEYLCYINTFGFYSKCLKLTCLKENKSCKWLCCNQYYGTNAVNWDYSVLNMEY